MLWLIIVIAAVVAIFAVPLRFRFQVHGEGRPAWQAELVWLGGLVCISRSAGGGWFRVGSVRKDLPRGAAKATKSSKPGHKASILARWRKVTVAERRAFVLMLRQIWAATDFAIKGSFRYGCDDPAVTAWLHAACCAVQGAGHLRDLYAEADFTQAGWSGNAEAGWSVRPLLVIVPVLRFLLILAGQRLRKNLTGGKKRWQVQT